MSGKRAKRLCAAAGPGIHAPPPGQTPQGGEKVACPLFPPFFPFFPLQSRGFMVEEQSHWPAARFEGYLARETAAKKLHGIFFWGHGQYEIVVEIGAKGKVIREISRGWVGVITDSSKKGNDAYLSRYENWNPSYKMGLGILFACGTQAARPHFSAKAVFWGSPVVLYPHGFHLFGPKVEELLPPGSQGTRELPPPKMETE